MYNPYQLAATRPRGRIQTLISDDQHRFVVRVFDWLTPLPPREFFGFPLEEDWVSIERKAHAEHEVEGLGDKLPRIHRRLVDQFKYDPEGLELFQVTVTDKELFVYAPKRLSDGACKAIFDAVVREYPYRSTTAAA